MSERKIYTVSMNGDAHARASMLCDPHEFGLQCGHCLDAPERIPAGSTAHLFANEEGTTYAIATNVGRWRA